MGKNEMIGERVKQMRQANNLTRAQLGERCGLDEHQITKIEENTEIPSLAPLIKVARAFGVRLGTFLDDQTENGPAICRKIDKKEDISFSNDNESARTHMVYHTLSNNKVDRHMEPFIVQVAPKSKVDFNLSSHEGEEFMYVLDGSIEVNYGDKEYIINKGESIYYDSIVPHLVRSANEQEASLLAVLYTPV